MFRTHHQKKHGSLACLSLCDYFFIGFNSSFCLIDSILTVLSLKKKQNNRTSFLIERKSHRFNHVASHVLTNLSKLFRSTVYRVMLQVDNIFVDASSCQALLSHRRALTDTTLAAASLGITKAKSNRRLEKRRRNKEHCDHQKIKNNNLKKATGKTERPVMVATMTTKRLGLVLIVTAHMVLTGKLTHFLLPKRLIVETYPICFSVSNVFYCNNMPGG